MKILDIIFMALKRLRTRLFETIVIILAIGLGTGVISVALAITFTARDQTQAMQESEHFRIINIRAGEDYMRQEVMRVGEKIPIPAKITPGVMYGVKENCSEVDYVFYSVGSSLQITEEFEKISPPLAHDRESMREWEEKRMESFLQVQTTTPDEFYFRELELEKGNYFTDQDVKEANRVIVLGYQAAEKLFPDVDAIDQKLPVVGQDSFTVIGILKELEEENDLPYNRASRYNNVGFIPLTIFQAYQMTQINNIMDVEINSFSAAVKSSNQLRNAEDQIRSYLRAQFTDGFNIMSPLTFAQDREQIRRGQIIAAFAASLGLLIAAINILNLMLARVLKRTRELGIIQALGSTRKNILYLFLTEAFLLGFLGALLGVALAYGGEKIIVSMLEGFPISIDWRVFIVALGISGFVSLLFGVYPATQASRIDPVEALRTE